MLVVVAFHLTLVHGHSLNYILGKLQLRGNSQYSLLSEDQSPNSRLTYMTSFQVLIVNGAVQISVFTGRRRVLEVQCAYSSDI